MALRMPLYSAPAPAPAPTVTVARATHASINTHRNTRLVMCANNQTCVNLQIKSSSHLIRNKVYEDAEAGVVCYKDGETGEVICEGLDEGPRFHHQQSSVSAFDLSSRDGEVKELLHRCWAQMVNENGVGRSDKEMAVKKDS